MPKQNKVYMFESVMKDGNECGHRLSSITVRIQYEKSWGGGGGGSCMLHTHTCQGGELSIQFLRMQQQGEFQANLCNKS